jgi:hypothetical protein
MKKKSLLLFYRGLEKEFLLLTLPVPLKPMRRLA